MNLSKRGSPAIMADNRARVFLSVYPFRLLALPQTIPRSHWSREIARGKTSIKQEPILGLYGRLYFPLTKDEVKSWRERSSTGFPGSQLCRN